MSVSSFRNKTQVGISQKKSDLSDFDLNGIKTLIDAINFSPALFKLVSDYFLNYFSPMEKRNENDDGLNKLFRLCHGT